MTPINPRESSTHQIIGTPIHTLSDCEKINMLQRWANIYIPYEPQPIWGEYRPSRSSCKWCAISDEEFEQQVLDSSDSGEESFKDLWFECFGQTISKDSIQALHEMCREEEAKRKAELEEEPFGNFRLNRYRQTISKDFIQDLHKRCCEEEAKRKVKLDEDQQIPTRSTANWFEEQTLPCSSTAKICFNFDELQGTDNSHTCSYNSYGGGVHTRQYDINLDIDDDIYQPTSSPELVVEQQDSVPTHFDQCVVDNELLSKYSEEQQKDLCGYAKRYELTIAEAIEYQTSCHNCGKEVKDGLFDDFNHQYCRAKCFDYCEDFGYPCFREGNCLVCSSWQYHEDRRDENEQ